MATYKTTDLTVFNQMLHEGVVDFEFIKKDGSTRKAKGTLVAEHLPAPKADAKPHKTNDNVMIYFDMEKQDFRSFVKTAFVGAY